MPELCRSPWDNNLGMRYEISHRTTYRYGSPVTVGNHVACLKPRSYVQNQLIENTLRISPAPATLTERVDYFGNVLWFFTVQEPHRELVVESTSDVLRTRGKTLDAQASAPWEESTRLLADDHSPSGLEAYQYQFESPRIRIHPHFAAYALQSFTRGRPMAEALLELTSRIHQDFRFDSRMTTVRTTTEEVFKKRGGVCQDFAHVQIACLRSINLAARYVSG
jgi:transglutaminase-like putative cysteine protease